MDASQDRLRGVLIAVVGVVCVSPDACLIRIISTETSATPMMIMIWKSLLKALMVCGVITSFTGWQAAMAGMMKGRVHALLGVIFAASLDVCFTSMILMTSVAR